MIPLDVPAHISGGNHFVTLGTLALLSSSRVLGWHRRLEEDIVVNIVGLCIFARSNRDVLVKSIGRKELVVVRAGGERLLISTLLLFEVVGLRPTPVDRLRPSSLQVHGIP